MVVALFSTGGRAAIIIFLFPPRRCTLNSQLFRILEAVPHLTSSVPVGSSSPHRDARLCTTTCANGRWPRGGTAFMAAQTSSTIGPDHTPSSRFLPTGQPWRTSQTRLTFLGLRLFNSRVSRVSLFVSSLRAHSSPLLLKSGSQVRETQAACLFECSLADAVIGTWRLCMAIRAQGDARIV